MVTEWNHKYWDEIKFTLSVQTLGNIFLIPFTLLMGSFGFLFTLIMWNLCFLIVISNSMYHNEQEIAKYNHEQITERELPHMGDISRGGLVLFNILTVGMYPLWYFLTRRKLIKRENKYSSNSGTDVDEQLQTNAIPEEIPRTTNFSVDYDSLINEEQIGSGGTAIVKRVTLPAIDGGTMLAVKEPRMSETLHTEQVDRILQEAKIWNKLDDHDHIVGVIDYDREPIPWIAMEYMDGGHLGERTGEMEVSQTLWTAIAVTKGVRHAHRRGIAHLDLKPQNILFRTVNDMWDVPKVADWGLSKHLLDHSRSIDGYTPVYSAPEQLDDGYGNTDDITDIYQLGAIFYELFTGNPPFDGETTGKLIRQILNEDPTPPSEIANVPDKLDTVLLTALSKNKKDRYEDILLLRNALQSVFEEHRSVEISQTDQEIGYASE